MTIEHLDDTNYLRALLMFVVWKYAHGKATITMADMQGTPGMSVHIETDDEKNTVINLEPERGN